MQVNMVVINSQNSMKIKRFNLKSEICSEKENDVTKYIKYKIKGKICKDMQQKNLHLLH
jgi:hypothetical protein